MLRIRGRTDIPLLAGSRGEFPHAPLLLGFLSADAAVAFLRRFRGDREAVSRWRDVLALSRPGAQVVALDDDELLALLADELRSGRIVLAPDVACVPRMPLVLCDGDDAALDESAATGAPPEERQAFELLVRSARDGRPLVGVPFDLVLPDGEGCTASTDSQGRIRLDDVDPGRVSLVSRLDEACWLETGEVTTTTSHASGVAPSIDACEPSSTERLPRWLATVRHVRGRAGESLCDVARRCGLDVDVLAHFNWGTTDPAQVQRRLHEEIGCSRRSDDAREWVFGEDDDPGLVFVPEPCTLDGLATGELHVLEVLPLTPPVGTLLVTTDLSLDEVSHDDGAFVLRSTTPELPYEVSLSVRDDPCVEDDVVDMRFVHVPTRARYSLSVGLRDGEELLLFEDVPYARLAGLSGDLVDAAVHPA